jgi:DNA topoisomerase VI subunit B
MSKNASGAAAVSGDETSKAKPSRKITTSSTAEYFSKNLQQVGFSSPTKAVLTTVKEAMDNSLDACEDHGILPDIAIVIEKLGAGTMKNTDKLRIVVTDNGPGIDSDDISKVFGEYLASSKFGRGRCSRGQQGIGISAATTWALQTTATPVRVITKTKDQRKAVSCSIEVDLKNNKGIARDKQTFDWDRPHGTKVEFIIEGRIQLNGEAGLLSYLRANVLVNPHMTLSYELPEVGSASYARVTTVVPEVPDATDPHPHTMKLGEFIAHARLFGRTKLQTWLKTGFSRMGDKVVHDLWRAQSLDSKWLDKGLEQLNDESLKSIYAGVQATQLMAPSTQSVVSIGEEALSLSVERLGEINFFAVSTRKPTICDFKPVQVEVAIARIAGVPDNDEPVQVLRFANRVPLQFDKASCAIVKAITTVNWRSYGLKQPKDALPTGPYIFAVSVVSPFIKFKNASKETIDASDELVEEIRRALMQAGQRLSRHLSRETKAADLEEKIQHIEKFGPVLVDTLVRITNSPEKRKELAYQGLKKILGRDTEDAQTKLQSAETKLDEAIIARKKRLKLFKDEDSLLESKSVTGDMEGDKEGDEEHATAEDAGETDAVDNFEEPKSPKGSKKHAQSKGARNEHKKEEKKEEKKEDKNKKTSILDVFVERSKDDGKSTTKKSTAKATGKTAAKKPSTSVTVPTAKTGSGTNKATAKKVEKTTAKKPAAKK